MTTTTPSQEARERAELNFKKKEMQAREASNAMAEYQAALCAEREKTARLRLLREAKQAADAAARAAAKAVGDAGANGAGEAKPSKVVAKKVPGRNTLDLVKRPARKRALAR